ncbi:hypothetical protein GE061_007013, partial [Apolygus lucorum]
MVLPTVFLITLGCTWKGKLGDITTLKRVGPAIEERSIDSVERDLYVTAQFTLKTMYMKYPECTISLVSMPKLHSKFLTTISQPTLDLYSFGKD